MITAPILTALLSLFGVAFAIYAFFEARRLHQKTGPLKRAVVVAAIGITLLLLSSFANWYSLYRESQDIPPEVKATSGIPVSPTLQKIETVIDVNDRVTSSSYTRVYPAEQGFKIIEAKFEEKGSRLLASVGITVGPEGRAATLRAVGKPIYVPKLFGLKLRTEPGVLSGRVVLTQQRISSRL